MNVGYIYVLTSPSGKHYVGQTWNFENRMYSYKRLKCKTQPKIYNALKKYGPENFEYDIVDMCYSQDELNDAEIYWGIFYDVLKNGYCLRLGDQNGTYSEEMKKFISEKTKEAMKTRKRTTEQQMAINKKLTGQKRNAETKSLMSKNRKNKNKGPKHQWYGKHLPLETRNKISKANFGKKRTEETKKKISENGKNIAYWKHHKMSDQMLENKSKAAELYEYQISDPTGNTYITKSLRKFCKEYGISNYRGLAKCACGQIPHYKKWKILRKLIVEVQSNNSQCIEQHHI